MGTHVAMMQELPHWYRDLNRDPEGINKASIRAGIERAARRLLGQGSLLEAISTRLGARFTGIIGALLIVGGTLAYHHSIERMAEIQEIMMHQYRSGNVSDDIMRRVTDIDPSRIMRYWQA